MSSMLEGTVDCRILTSIKARRYNVSHSTYDLRNEHVLMHVSVSCIVSSSGMTREVLR